MPKTNAESGEYIYKTVTGKNLRFTFLPPLCEKFKGAPLYFLIPGGGWRSADMKSMINFSNQSVDALRKNGFAVISIEYRTVDTQIKISDSITDCFDALGFICENSADFNIDIKRIVLSGHSAGAHLALMLSYADGKFFTNNYDFDSIDFKVMTVAALSPATILYEVGCPKTIGFGTDYLFLNPNDLEERKKASPIEYVNPNCPPTILFAGTKDNLIYCQSSQLLYSKLKENYVKSRIILSVNAGHSFEQISADENPSISFDEIQNQLTEFVTECVKKGE